MKNVTRFTVAPRALSQCGDASDWMGRRSDRRKIMSKTSAEPRELRDDDLDRVTGGLVVNAIIAVLIGLLLPEPPPTGGKHGIGPV